MMRPRVPNAPVAPVVAPPPPAPTPAAPAPVASVPPPAAPPPTGETAELLGRLRARLATVTNEQTRLTKAIAALEESP